MNLFLLCCCSKPTLFTSELKSFSWQVAYFFPVFDDLLPRPLSRDRVGYSGCKTSTPLPKFTAVSLSSAEESLGSFSNDDGDGIEDVKKAIALLRKTTTLHVHHAFLYISLPSLHDYDVKMPNCKFYGGREQATTNLFFSL